MKERPILFNTEMIQQIHAGRKTQTRRIVNPQPDEICIKGYHPNLKFYGLFPGSDFIDVSKDGDEIKNPYGTRGDQLYVRETWRIEGADKTTNTLYVGFKYGAYSDIQVDDETFRKYCPETPCVPGKWRPSIFMPKEFARFYLKIEQVWMHRLQGISYEECRAEGIKKYACNPAKYHNYIDPSQPTYSEYIAFKSLWESIHGPRSWDENPYVWAIEFKLRHVINTKYVLIEG